jgi:hypothetical protein
LPPQSRTARPRNTHPSDASFTPLFDGPITSKLLFAFIYCSFKKLASQCLVELVEALVTTGGEQRRRAKKDDGDVSFRLVEREAVVAWCPAAVPEEPRSALVASCSLQPKKVPLLSKRNELEEAIPDFAGGSVPGDER